MTIPRAEVLWNGSRMHPGGPYLFVEAWRSIKPEPAQPLRRASELTAAERQQVIADVHATTYRAAALKHRLCVSTVQKIVGDNTKGLEEVGDRVEVWSRQFVNRWVFLKHQRKAALEELAELIAEARK